MNIHPKTNDAYKLFHRGTEALSNAEHRGMRVDLDYIKSKREELGENIKELKEKFYNSEFYFDWKKSRKGKPVNINSYEQLSEFLYNYKGYIPPEYTDKGNGSTSKSALQKLNIEEMNYLLRIRKLQDIKDKFLLSFERERVNGYIHPFFDLSGVTTFRSSSRMPNFQNIPKRDKEAMEVIRQAILPRPGYQLMEVDYSGLEVAIGACYHKDPNMIAYLKDPYADLHGDMTQQLFLWEGEFDKHDPKLYDLRKCAKNGFVWGEFYGSYYKDCAYALAVTEGGLPEKGKWKSGQGNPLPGDINLSDHLIRKGIKSLPEYVEHVKEVEDDFWGRRFKKYQQWKNNLWEFYKKNGYVDMHTGFRVQGLMKRNNIFNYLIQGAGFHALLWSFIEVDRIMREEGWNTRLIGQVHDSMILDVDPAERDYVAKTVRYVTTKKLPEAWPWIIIPLDVEAELCPVDESWNKKEDYEI